MGELPNMTQNPVVDLLDIGHPAQSLFVKAVSLATNCDAINRPCPGY